MTQTPNARNNPELDPDLEKPVVNNILEAIQKFLYELVSNFIKKNYYFIKCNNFNLVTQQYYF